jgi:RND family efflux transporter MFP subunit
MQKIKKHTGRLTKLSSLSATVLFSMLPFSKSYAQASPQLVSVAFVEPWTSGEVKTINCSVSVPLFTSMSSESNAKLTYLTPKGTKVKRGELIAKQHDFYHQQQLTRLQQQLVIDQSNVNFQSLEYDRLFKLQDNLSTSQLDKALSLKQQFIAKHKQTMSEINELEQAIIKLQFFAPADGAIVETNAAPGDYLNKGQKLLSFVSENDKELKCLLPLSEFDKYREGTYQLSSDDKLNTNNSELFVVRTDELVEDTSQFLSVYLKHTQPLPHFLGQRVKVKLNYKNTKLTRLPADGLNLAQTGDFVWRVSQEGIVSKVAISVYANYRDYFLVESELKPGEQIVTFGKAGLINNQAVKTLPEINNNFRQAKRGAL